MSRTSLLIRVLVVAQIMKMKNATGFSGIKNGLKCWFMGWGSRRWIISKDFPASRTSKSRIWDRLLIWFRGKSLIKVECPTLSAWNNIEIFNCKSSTDGNTEQLKKLPWGKITKGFINTFDLPFGPHNSQQHRKNEFSQLGGMHRSEESRLIAFLWNNNWIFIYLSLTGCKRVNSSTKKKTSSSDEKHNIFPSVTFHPPTPPTHKYLCNSVKLPFVKIYEKFGTFSKKNLHGVRSYISVLLSIFCDAFFLPLTKKTQSNGARHNRTRHVNKHIKINCLWKTLPKCTFKLAGESSKKKILKFIGCVFHTNCDQFFRALPGCKGMENFLALLLGASSSFAYFALLILIDRS